MLVKEEHGRRWRAQVYLQPATGFEPSARPPGYARVLRSACKRLGFAAPGPAAAAEVARCGSGPRGRTTAHGAACVRPARGAPTILAGPAVEQRTSAHPAPWVAARSVWVRIEALQCNGTFLAAYAATREAMKVVVSVTSASAGAFVPRFMSLRPRVPVYLLFRTNVVRVFPHRR
jgi:hypothetical protein